MPPLAAATTLLSEVPEAPLTLALRPNVLSAVTRSADTVDARFLQSLAAPDLQATVARMPYVAVDTGGLLAVGGGGDLLRQVDLGDRTLSASTGRRPVPTTWYLDDTVSPEALPLLASLGTDRVVVLLGPAAAPDRGPGRHVADRRGGSAVRPRADRDQLRPPDDVAADRRLGGPRGPGQPGRHRAHDHLVRRGGGPRAQASPGPAP